MALMILQNALTNAIQAPNFWPITLVASLLTSVATAWTLLGRISDRFNKAFDAKIGPLAKEMKDQGERLQKEAIRLEGHFDEAIRDRDDQWRKELNGISGSLREENRQILVLYNELKSQVRENRAIVDTNTRDLQESRMDRAQIRREIDALGRTLESFERAAEGGRKEILDAITNSKDALQKNQGDFSTRLTRVEEALKFYAKVRLEQQ